MKLFKTIIPYTISVLVVIALIYAYLNSEGKVPTERHIPTNSVNNFYIDSSNIVKLYKDKSKLLTRMLENELKVIADFSNLYKNNPRLSKEQDAIEYDISMLGVSYSLYVYGIDSTKDIDIKSSNDGIEFMFKILEKYNEDGYLK